MQPTVPPPSPKDVSFAVAAGACVVLACVLVPLRPRGGDTVPGRLGAAVLRCTGAQDLSGVDWLAARGLGGQLPYYVVPTSDGRGLVSTFGPAPAVLGALALPALSRGQEVSDEFLRQRARLAGSVAVGLSAFFVAMAAIARVGRLGLTAGLVSGWSFAGIATLGQALWQQTAALPFLCAALASTFLGPRARDARILIPALVTVACWIRPAEAPLAFAIVLADAFGDPSSRPTRRQHVLGWALAVAVSVPFATWFASTQGTPWPFAAQWAVNHRGDSAPFSADPSTLLRSLTGLLMSPGKGLLVFAPVFVLAVGSFGDRRARIVGAGCLAQLLVVAAFHKWWGGIGFGPRLLALPLFVLCALAVPEPRTRARVAIYALTAALTATCGIAGAMGYDPRAFDLAHDVDNHPERFFAFRPSPFSELRFGSTAPPLRDAPDVVYEVCGDVPLRTLRRR